MMHNHMFDPPIIQVRRLVESGALGELIYCEGRHFIDIDKMAKENLDRPDHWVHTLGTRMAGEYSPHAIYLLQSFFGPCRELQLMHGQIGSHKDKGLPSECFAIQLSFEKVFGKILLVDRMPYGHFSIDIYGTRAVAHINMMDLTFRIERIRSGLPVAAAHMESTFEQGLQNLWQTLRNAFHIVTGRLKRRPGHRALISTFYHCLQNGKPVPIPVEDGMDTVRTIEMLEDALSVKG
jgi:predicted dehydrogenase